MSFCLICKEVAGERFSVEVKDTTMETGITATLCRFCYNKCLDSFYDKGFFKVAKMVNWLKRKDPLRVI